MNGVVNLRELEEGVRIRTSDGAIAEVVSNPRDGVWIFARYLSSPEDASLEGTEAMLFAGEIAELLEGP